MRWRRRRSSNTHHTLRHRLRLNPRHRRRSLDNTQTLLHHPHNLHQPRLKNQGSVPRNHRRTPTLPISQFGGDRQRPFLPRTHLQQPFLPSSDHLPRAEGEFDGFAAFVGFVEELAGGLEGAAVVDCHSVAGLRGAGAGDCGGCVDFEVGGEGESGEKEEEEG